MNGWPFLGPHGLGWADLAQFFLHFVGFSLMSVGGVIATASEMQHYLVLTKGWLNDEVFSASIAMAQAAPGPNVLFVALLGLNSAGVLGILLAMAGIMVPSSVLALQVGRLRGRWAESVPVRALTAGLAPLTLGLLLSTGWLLLAPTRGDWEAALLVVGTVVTMLVVKVNPVVLIVVGALLGGLGLL